MVPCAPELRRLAAVAGLAIVLTACATGVERQQDAAGPVTWSVGDVTQIIRSDGRGIRWDYTLTLKETKGVGIQFEKADWIMVGRSVDSSLRSFDYRQRLGPNSQLQFTGWNAHLYRAHVIGGGFASGAGFTVVDDAVTVVRRFHGKNDSGKAVTVEVRIPLDRTTGRRLRNPGIAPGPVASSRAVDGPGIRALAGEWRGHSRDQNGFDLPLHLVVKEDGSFDAAEGDPVRSRYQGTLSVRDGQILVVTRGGNKGTLGLHEESGTRILAGSFLVSTSQPPFTYNLRLEPKPPSAATAAVTPPPRPVPPVAPVPAPATASPPAAGIRASYRVNSSALRVKLGYRSPGGRTEEREVVIPADVIWELLFTAREGDALEVTAQNPGESGWVSCEIVVDGTAISASTREGNDPLATCRATIVPR